MDFSQLETLSLNEIMNEHSKTLYRSICVPSTVQSYSLCVEFMKKWFLSKFSKDTFKSVYVEGKNIYDDFRSMSKIELLKRPKPSLAIVPSIDWEFNNENIDTYPYGLELYAQAGKFKESFFQCPETKSYLGIGLETIHMPFGFRVRVETRAQQLDMYKLIKMACRVGFTCGDDIDLDFHIPYPLMVQIAKDNGFKTRVKDGKDYILEVPKFLRWLNMHSSLPFLYKFRALNGKNEFFLRMTNMYVHIRPTNLNADDGEREGQLSNNFVIDLSVEVRFPAPKMYAYYSDNEHKLQEIYGVWYQPNGPISTCYTFKGTSIPDKNKYGWPLYMSTTYEEDNEECINKPLEIDVAELLEGDIGECIKDCLSKGLSPGIFCDLIFYNGGEYMDGNFNWETLHFSGKNIARSLGTYIGIYIDNNYLTDFITSRAGYADRIQPTKK